MGQGLFNEPGGEGRAGGSTKWRDGQEVAKQYIIIQTIHDSTVHKTK